MLTLDDRHRLITAHLRFVVAIAARYRDRGVPMDELVGEGNLGLVQAARLFDPSRQVRFTTYAIHWIRRGILRAVASHHLAVHVPEGRKRRLRSFRELGALSLSAPIDPDGERTLEDTLAAPPAQGPLRAVERREAERRVRRALLSLGRREREVIGRRFGIAGGAPAALRTIGVALGVSGEAVRGIEKRALRRLRAAVIRSALRSHNPSPMASGLAAP